MSKKKVSDIVSEMIDSFLVEKNLELVDVEFVKEGAHRYLRVYVDKDGGVGLDDCQLVSEYLSEKLDKFDPIKENYYLEVSSPGLERPLKKESDFIKYNGKKVEVKLFQPISGQKVLVGKLVGYNAGVVTILEELSGANIEIAKDKIALIRLMLEF